VLRLSKEKKSSFGGRKRAKPRKKSPPLSPCLGGRGHPGPEFFSRIREFENYYFKKERREII